MASGLPTDNGRETTPPKGIPVRQTKATWGLHAMAPADSTPSRKLQRVRMSQRSVDGTIVNARRHGRLGALHGTTLDDQTPVATRLVGHGSMTAAIWCKRTPGGASAADCPCSF